MSSVLSQCFAETRGKLQCCKQKAIYASNWSLQLQQLSSKGWTCRRRRCRCASVTKYFLQKSHASCSAKDTASPKRSTRLSQSAEGCLPVCAFLRNVLPGGSRCQDFCKWGNLFGIQDITYCSGSNVNMSMCLYFSHSRCCSMGDRLCGSLSRKDCKTLPNWDHFNSPHYALHTSR